MKTFTKILMAAAIVLSLTACNYTPYADLEISKTKVKAGEPIQIKNKSMNCDISMVILGGEGIYNNNIRVGEDFEVTDQNFVFTYLKPGKYLIRVVAENSKSATGTNYDTREAVVEVVAE